MQQPAPPDRRGVGKGAVVAIAIGAFLFGAVGGCAVGCSYGSYESSTSSPSSPLALPKPKFPASPADTAKCHEAPQRIVDMIDAAFTDPGEHLEHAQAVDGPQSMVYVGGNIFDSTGQKVSSQDTWVMSNGQLYALTSDARRRTLLPDGRDLEAHYWTWTDYNDAVGKCVGALERAANQGH